jgi:DNA modification methylase
VSDRLTENTNNPWSWADFETTPLRSSGASHATDEARALPFLAREGTLLVQLATLTSRNAFETTYLTHGLHPYPAKYIPQLPNLIVREHTNERNTVLDPFCGSGTTLVEAAVLGRKSIGIDSHPIATLISRAKTTALSASEIHQAEAFLAWARTLERAPVGTQAPDFNGLDVNHWFPAFAIYELAFLRQSIEGAPTDALRDFLRCIFSAIIVPVSYQESETRYAAIEKPLKDGDVFRRFSQKLSRELPNVRALSGIPNVARNKPVVHNADVREAHELGLADATVDLVVTSPPYPNSFDYYLYHKWRMFWLGHDHVRVKDREIGSRREHSSQKRPIATYVEKMRAAMVPIARLLKPSKLAYFFVGDAVINGELINICDTFKEITRDTDLRLIAETNYSLEEVTRSFREKTSDGCHGGRRRTEKRQHVLVFERINRGRIAVSSERRAASPQATRASTDLDGAIPNGATVALRSDIAQRHIHSLGRYPSRFIPDIPRWAVAQFSNEGDTVLDPFVGSGSTGVESLTQGRHFIGCDYSPYSCLLTSAKLAHVSEGALTTWAHKIANELSGRIPQLDVPQPTFPLDTFWFHPEYLRQIAQLKAFVERNVPGELRFFFLAVISTVIRPCSFQDEGQVKVKRDPKKVLHGCPSPFDLLPGALKKNLERKLQFLQKSRPSLRSSVIRASADSLWPGYLKASSIDLVVTSPPYINAMNYPMTHRYENMLLGLLDERKKIDHERGYFGSERVYASEYNKVHYLKGFFPQEERLNQLLIKVFDGEPKRSFIAYSYFVEMYSTFHTLREVLKPGGRFVLVAGRNTIRGVYIDTFGFLAQMLVALDFKCERHFNYEIIKNAFKLTRHPTADIINTDGVGVFVKSR